MSDIMNAKEGELSRSYLDGCTPPSNNDTWAMLDFSVFDYAAKHLHANSKAKGFYDNEWNFFEKMALIHSEVSEAVEAYRKSSKPDDHCPEFDNITIELADIIIRVLDTCGYMSLPIGEAIKAKANFNATRPYKHGKRA